MADNAAPQSGDAAGSAPSGSASGGWSHEWLPSCCCFCCFLAKIDLGELFAISICCHACTLASTVHVMSPNEQPGFTGWCLDCCLPVCMCVPCRFRGAARKRFNIAGEDTPIEKYLFCCSGAQTYLETAKREPKIMKMLDWA